MEISFFEEFPTPENIKKLQLVTFPTKLYLAAYSLEEFNALKRKIKNQQVKEVVYWPLLSKEEGYWFSPFAKRSAMKRIFSELEGKDVPVMIDAELPFTQNFSLLFTQSFNFFRNKALLKRFIKNHKKVYTAEYYPGDFNDFILSCLGLHFDPKACKSKMIRMAYHSMHPLKESFPGVMEESRKKYGRGFLVGYGTLIHGIKGDEPPISLEQLEMDLKLAKKAGVNEVVLFRLGGLDKKYVQLLNKYKG